MLGQEEFAGAGDALETPVGHREDAQLVRGAEAILQGARFTPDSPLVLKPKNPKFYLDSRYILFAAGLLGQTHPREALEVMQKYLKRI